MTWIYWLTFQGLQAAADVTTPSVLVHSDDCVLPANAKAVFDSLRGKKQLVWTEGSQTDFYDQEPFVSKAVAAVHEHFAATLN